MPVPTASHLLAALGAAGALVLPVECAGCGRWDVALCPGCAALLAAAPARCDADLPLLDAAAASMPVWAVGPYRGPLRALVVAWKNHRRQDIAADLLAAAQATAAGWIADPAVRAAMGLSAESPPRLVLVVPAPSGWRRRLAHRLVVLDLAQAVARGIATGLLDAAPATSPDAAPVAAPGSAPAATPDAAADGRTEVLVVDVLRRRGGADHQAGRGARARGANRAGMVVALAPLPAEAAVVLVDDVVTTGATLAACASALADAGSPPRAAWVLAAAPPPRRARAVPGGSRPPGDRRHPMPTTVPATP
ncbi:ComF family protein [Georgenia sp. TF02-10]|uniref:ComF family protein n=1 Tax=Georgenia sp. TF02-10 TaxID=2917725 RepID=UPI001FA81426|nr:ComF family protein [Georgenia sp. TF02-10]UNX55819.1 ComF family protein [Georgenia sp. TF02-10]